ncbi:hypothetical protein [Rhodococcus ruber]|uniref:hypothetical protein n=1 Tax=Rhodococcus ruber TaxID=1830 RepID=UPI00315D90BF
MPGTSTVAGALPHLDQDARGESFATDIILEADYYERGVAARRAVSEGLHDLTDVHDAIEDQADKLLDGLLALLDTL